MQRRTFLTASAATVGLVGSGGIGWKLGTDHYRSNHAQASWFRAGPADAESLGSLQVLWSVTTDQSLAALTFDDGPDPAFTPRVLELLANFGVSATFNLMGYNVLGHPDLAREVIAAGHEIGTHTHTHFKASKLSPPEARDEIRKGLDAIASVGVSDVRWFRPPNGELTGYEVRAVATADLDVLMWSVQGSTAGTPTSAEISKRLITAIGPGDIVSLHDGIGRGTFAKGEPIEDRLTERREAEIGALEATLAGVADNGITLVTVSELLASGSAN